MSRVRGYLAAAAAAAFAAAPSAEPATVLLHNGLVHTASARGTLAGASVLIVGGRVAAVGRELKAPAGAEVIELAGRPVTPALFGGLSPLGVSEIGLEPTSDDSALTLGQMRPEFDPALAFNPDSVPVAVTRVEGVGFAVLAPRSEPDRAGAPGGSIIAGQASVVRLDGRSPRPPVALIVTVDKSAAALAGHTRAAAWMLLAQAFEEARGPAQPTTPEARLLTPAGRRVLKGFIGSSKPVLFAANRAADIRAALAFASREQLHAVILGGAEAWRVAPALARANVAVVLDPLNDLPASFDAVGATLENAARLQAAGVMIAFSFMDGEPHNVRKLRQTAGIAVAHGLPWAAALAALSSAPARIFGAATEFGSIEPGKPANLVVWNGDPLEVTSLVDAEWLDGRRIPLSSRQTELRDRYLAKIRAGAAR